MRVGQGGRLWAPSVDTKVALKARLLSELCPEQDVSAAGSKRGPKEDAGAVGSSRQGLMSQAGRRSPSAVASAAGTQPSPQACRLGRLDVVSFKSRPFHSCIGPRHPLDAVSREVGRARLPEPGGRPTLGPIFLSSVLGAGKVGLTRTRLSPFPCPRAPAGTPHTTFGNSLSWARCRRSWEVSPGCQPGTRGEAGGAVRLRRRGDGVQPWPWTVTRRFAGNLAPR